MTSTEQSYLLGEIVVIRPFAGAYCEVPAEVIEITDDGYRRDVRFASGRAENVGIGNMRRAEQWQVASFREMRRVSKQEGSYRERTA